MTLKIFYLDSLILARLAIEAHFLVDLEGSLGAGVFEPGGEFREVVFIPFFDEDCALLKGYALNMILYSIRVADLYLLLFHNVLLPV